MLYEGKNFKNHSFRKYSLSRDFRVPQESRGRKIPLELCQLAEISFDRFNLEKQGYIFPNHRRKVIFPVFHLWETLTWGVHTTQSVLRHDDIKSLSGDEGPHK